MMPANAANKAVTWSSSNDTVATVDANGQVTGKAGGSATITATSADGGKKATCAVTVTISALVSEIKGIPIPFDGEHPVMTITETNQYSGSISWTEAGNILTAASVFDGSKSYTAIITLTLKEPYSTDPISYNYFSVPGATCYNINKSTTIKAYFYPSDQYWVDATTGSVITAYSGPGKALVLPEKINEIPIVGIGANAFQNKDVTEITIPDSVTAIASMAFSGNPLTKITLGAGLDIADDTAMGANGSAFKTAYDTGYNSQPRLKGNYSFLNSAWHYSGKQVGKLWFDDNGLVTSYEGTEKNLVIPDGNNITAIAPAALANKGIETLSLPASLLTIGFQAFKGNPICDINIGAGVVIDGTEALGNETSSFVAAYSSKAAGNYHCYYEDMAHPNISTWYFSDIVLNGMAFNTSSQIINSYNGTGGQLTIPSLFSMTTVKVIYKNSFRAKKLTGLSFSDGCEITNIGEDAFFQNTIKNLTLPDSLKTIGGSAFGDCQMESVVLPSSLTSIGLSAFSSNQLTSITIPDSVTAIGAQAFVVNKLTSVVIEGTDGSDLTIEPGAFQSISVDTNLITAITIPANVTIPDDTTMGKYGAAFRAFYEGSSNNKVGGVFNYDITSGQWNKK